MRYKTVGGRAVLTSASLFIARLGHDLDIFFQATTPSSLAPLKQNPEGAVHTELAKVLDEGWYLGESIHYHYKPEEDLLLLDFLFV
jgi:hypothetical protein